LLIFSPYSESFSEIVRSAGTGFVVVVDAVSPPKKRPTNRLAIMMLRARDGKTVPYVAQSGIGLTLEDEALADLARA
jgi:hypothetical protein